MFNDYPDVVTVDDLRQMLHIGRSAAYSLLKSGRIKTLKFGKKYIIPKSSVIDFLNTGLRESNKNTLKQPSAACYNAINR